MRKIVPSNKFKKDLEVATRRGFNIELLKDVIEKLANGESLEAKHHDHPLIGDFIDFRECHIQSNWLLIYRIDDEELELYLFRTGTHSDLF